MRYRIATASRPGLAAWVCILLLAAAPLLADPVVFRVSRDAAPASYLVGTMHSEDPRVTALVARLLPVLQRVDALAIEVVPDALTLLAAGAATLLPADQALRDLAGEARFAALVEAMRPLGLPPGAVDRLKPWAAAVILGLPAAGSGRFLDMEIYLAALQQGRDVIGLETAAEQLGIFDSLAPDLQLALLDDAIKNAAAMPTHLETLTAAYLDGDLERLGRVARAQQRDLPAALVAWFEDRLLAGRNARMVERLAGQLPQRSLLIAVGALHLGGPDGVVAGLRGLGYRVEALPAAPGPDG